MSKSSSAPLSQCNRYIGLVRVSTPRQGDSGLGLGSGLDEIERFVAVHGGEIVQTLKEVESGMLSTLVERPTLDRALKLCKRKRCWLLLPRVDRLGRSMAVLTDVRRSGVQIRFADQPHATEEIIDMLMTMAAFTGRKIGETSRNALAYYIRTKRVSKANCIRLEALYGPRENWPQWEIDRVAGKLGAALVGCHLTEEDRAKGRARMAANALREANEAYEDLAPEMKSWKDSGLTLRAIADRLNERGERTRNDAAWTQTQVKRVLDRLPKPSTPEIS